MHHRLGIFLEITHSAHVPRAQDAVENTLRKNAWHVELSDGSLIWRAPEMDGLQDTRTEPDASLDLQLLIKLLGPLAPDSML